MAVEQFPLTISDLRAHPDRLLSQAETAPVIKKSEAWLERCRWAKTGPAYIKVGRTPYYKAGDLLAFIEAGRVEPSRQQQAA